MELGKLSPVAFQTRQDHGNPGMWTLTKGFLKIFKRASSHHAERSPDGQHQGGYWESVAETLSASTTGQSRGLTSF